jgi:hypothetical protein
MKDNAIIYDFETLSQNAVKCAVVNMAFLSFNIDRLVNNHYTFDSLVDKAIVLKFDIEEQVKEFGREICKDTLRDFWEQQPAEVRAQLKPAPNDVSIRELPHFFKNNIPDNLKSVWSRGNAFDPVILKTICDSVGERVPYAWWLDRDTRSFIEGLTFGSNISNKFIPPQIKNFSAHDSRQDVAMDVMRMQTLIYEIHGDDIPF